MSTFRYMKGSEPMSGVQCDACSFRLYTDTTGEEFGLHMSKAKQKGWLITKEDGNWINLCPVCRKKPREKHLINTKPIETEYKGYRFRSRLEARWAVFFDAGDIDYVYEPEGFTLSDGTRYLPDFYLPEFDAYVEVKRNTPDGIAEVIDKCSKAITWGGPIKRLIILSDIPKGESTDGGMWQFPALYWNDNDVEWGWWFFISGTKWYPEEHLATSGFITSAPYERSLSRIKNTQSILAVSDVELMKNTVFFSYHKDRWTNEKIIAEEIRLQHEYNPTVYETLTKARQARFEYGEKGGLSYGK